MTETYDAIVIGAGLNGASTAYFLLKHGLKKVLVIDADLPGSGASGAAVGLLRSHYDNRPETELAAKSMPYFRHWADMIGGDCGYVETGFYRFVETHELASMHANVAVQREYGETVEILSPAQARAKAPEFKTDDVGAVVFEPHCGTASNSRATFSMLAHACALGAVVRPFTRAVSLVVTAGEIRGVQTGTDFFSAPIVVLAAGTSSKAIAATAGVELGLVAPRDPRRGNPAAGRIATFRFLHGPDLRQLDIAARTGRALISVPNAAARDSIEPETYDGTFTRQEAESGLVAVRKRIPGIDGATVVRWWTRPECFAADGKPIIGPVDEVKGLYLNTAAAGKGHKVAPAAALALSELIVEGQARSANLAPFGIARLREPLKPWSDSEYGKRVIG